MTKTWFTADPHFGHERVSELRGFNSTDRHDEVILGHLHDSLSKGDNLWVLGDLSAGGKAAQLRALDIMEELKEDTGVTMHLIPGNHDGVHPMHRRSLNWYEEYLSVFESIQAYSRRKLAGRHVWVSHFPWKGGGDHTEDERYSTVRLNRENEADWLLHGHTHSPVKTDPAQRMINVGVDAWDLKPVTIYQIENAIENVEKELSRRKEQEADMPSTVRKSKPRLKSCIEQWPECSSGEYNPSCCRFPKSCSCDGYRDEINPELLEFPLPYEHTLAAWLER